jgi:hypothetical protein
MAVGQEFFLVARPPLMMLPTTLTAAATVPGSTMAMDATLLSDGR